MKFRLKSTLLLVTIFLLLVIVGYTEENVDNTFLATPDNPVKSPTGKYQLQVVVGYNGIVHFNRFDIAKFRSNSDETEIIFSSKDTFRTRNTNFFMWDSNERVWVYSGDLGVFYWTKDTEDKWVKHDYTDGDIKPPKFIANYLNHTLNAK